MPETTPGTGATPGTPATGAQAGTAADAGATTGQQRDAAAQGGQGGTTTDDGATDDQGLGAGGQSALEKERAARREAERLHREAQAQIKTLTEKDLPEAERAQRRLADLEQQSRSWEVERAQMRTEIEVARHATRLGFRDPADAFALIDAGSIERDADGRPQNVETVLKNLLRDKPYLRATASTGAADQGSRGQAGNGTQGGKPADMNNWLRDQVRARRGQPPEVTTGG